MRKPGRQTTDLEESPARAAEDGAEARLPFLGRIDGADPADVVRRREIAARLQTALDALPSYHRAVIVMREIEGLSYEEMAQAMGVSKGTIMSRLFHARQKLQRALADCYEEQVGARPPGAGPGAASRRASHEPLAGDHARAHGARRRRARGGGRRGVEQLVAESDEARRVVEAMQPARGRRVARRGEDARARRRRPTGSPTP